MDDVEAIKQLKARYFRTMDTKDWAGMRQVFADDVVMDTTDSGGGVVTGADAFLQFLQQTLADAITVHHGHMPEIELTSATTATGIWALHDVIEWPDGTRLQGTATTTRSTSEWTGRGASHPRPSPAYGWISPAPTRSNQPA